MDDDAIRSYAASWEDLASAADRLPLARPLRVRRVSTVFVAETVTFPRQSVTTSLARE
jgi:hypothetical protein